MQIEELQKSIRREFGDHLQHVTPANARAFVERLQTEGFSRGMREAIELNEQKASYDEIMRDFFIKVLEAPRDEGLIMLWTTAFDLYFYVLGEHLAQRYGSLMSDIEEPTD